MNKIAFVFVITLIATGCTTVRYNGSETFVSEVDYPEIGRVVTAYVGDHLVQKGSIIEERVLVVRQKTGGALYTIPAKTYIQLGFNDVMDFYSADGVIRRGLADPIQALALGKAEGSKLCVVTTFGGRACYRGEYDRKKRLSEQGNSFQQTLIYSGRVGNKINVGYREYSNNTARPAFNNNVEYDLTSSNTIGYKGALIEVIEADNSKITYRLIRNFPQ